MEQENQGNNLSKKKLYMIMGGVVILLVGWSLIGGLGRSLTGVGVDKDNGGSTTYSKNDGSVTVEGNKLPDNWPSDAPKYKNAQILSSVASNPQTGEAGAVIAFSTSDSIQTVIDFYKKELASNGWTVEQTIATETGTILVATKDDRDFSVYIGDSGDGKVGVTVSISTP